MSVGAVSVADLCRKAGMSRQNFYKRRARRKRRDLDEQAALRLVKAERRLQPKLGARKLLKALSGGLAEAGVRIGRDRFLDLLRREGLLVRRRRCRARTTDSRHEWGYHRNLTLEWKPTAAHQLWVSDLTYLDTAEGFVYLSLVTDAHSRKIVGWHVSDGLEALGCVKAVRQALRQLPAGARPIHHSDRGVQYCCKRYTGLLKRRRVRISMTEQNHCYENALAERVNGILKQEYGLGDILPGKAAARRAVRQAVWLYNNRRPHMMLGYRTPLEVHLAAA